MPYLVDKITIDSYQEEDDQGNPVGDPIPLSRPLHVTVVPAEWLPTGVFKRLASLQDEYREIKSNQDPRVFALIHEMLSLLVCWWDAVDQKDQELPIPAESSAEKSTDEIPMYMNMQIIERALGGKGGRGIDIPLASAMPSRPPSSPQTLPEQQETPEAEAPSQNGLVSLMS